MMNNCNEWVKLVLETFKEGIGAQAKVVQFRSGEGGGQRMKTSSKRVKASVTNSLWRIV